MNLNFFQLRSIKTRVTLFTLTIFVLSIWAISLYVSRTLRDDMQRVLGEQHFQTTSMVAQEISTDVRERFKALGLIAERVSLVMPSGAAAIQTELDNLPLFQGLFNTGSFVIGMDGTVIASSPVSLGRKGINVLDRDFIVSTLREGKSSVSKPMIGKVNNIPVFAMTAPIRDPQGKVIGALIGVTDLSQPNFLDKIAKASFNKTGVVSVISSQYRATLVDRSINNITK